MVRGTDEQRRERFTGGVEVLQRASAPRAPGGPVGAAVAPTRHQSAARARSIAPTDYGWAGPRDPLPPRGLAIDQPRRLVAAVGEEGARAPRGSSAHVPGWAA